MFPNDFPFINEISDANFIATPDRYFLPLGTDLKAAIKEMPIVPAMK